MAVLSRSSTLSKLAVLKISMSSGLFSTTDSSSVRQGLDESKPVSYLSTRCRLNVYMRFPNLFNSYSTLPDGPRCHCPAHNSRNEKRIFGHSGCQRNWRVLIVQQVCQSWLKIFVPTVPFRQSSQLMSCSATLPICMLTALPWFFSRFFMLHVFVNVLQKACVSTPDGRGH